MYTNIDAAIAALEKGDSFERFKYSNFRNNRRVVMVAVQKNGYALAHASKELKNDREIVLAALIQEEYDTSVPSTGSMLTSIGRSGYSSLIIYASEEIQRICKNKDPIEALTKAINYEKLTTKLSPGVEVDQPKRKLKI